MKRYTFSRKLGTASIAAGAAALGAADTAEAALQVFDHRAAPLSPFVEYFAFDQTLIVMNVKTGDFQYVIEEPTTVANGVNEVQRFNQDGFVDNNLIPDTDLTDDTVWLSHRDMVVPGKSGAADGVALETPTGGAMGQYDAAGTVYSPQRVPGENPANWSPHDWYWADQTWDHDDNPGTADASVGLPFPSDTGAGEPLPNIQIDGSLVYNDSSPTGYTGAVTHGFGGSGHGNGSPFGVSAPDGSYLVTVGFKLDEPDGTHYGWVAMRHNRGRANAWVHGWAYETTPDTAAALDWDPATCTCAPGDFDGDGDVDADDVDMLCANMGGDAGTYDMDGDGDVDEDDMTFHVENHLEYDSDGDGVVDGTGTFRGDFNLDGIVNGTDLSIMSGGFGTTTGFAGGNANCDSTVNGTDLSILSSVFGNVATTAVPEPLTITVLSLGAVGMLRRRKA